MDAATGMRVDERYVCSILANPFREEMERYAILPTRKRGTFAAKRSRTAAVCRSCDLIGGVCEPERWRDQWALARMGHRRRGPYGRSDQQSLLVTNKDLPSEPDHTEKTLKRAYPGT